MLLPKLWEILRRPAPAVVLLLFCGHGGSGFLLVPLSPGPGFAAAFLMVFAVSYFGGKPRLVAVLPWYFYTTVD
jgi:hypothetical protein